MKLLIYSVHSDNFMLVTSPEIYKMMQDGVDDWDTYAKAYQALLQKIKEDLNKHRECMDMMDLPTKWRLAARLTVQRFLDMWEFPVAPELFLDQDTVELPYGIEMCSRPVDYWMYKAIIAVMEDCMEYEFDEVPYQENTPEYPGRPWSNIVGD